jgi:hypothetical protein
MRSWLKQVGRSIRACTLTDPVQLGSQKEIEFCFIFLKTAARVGAPMRKEVSQNESSKKGWRKSSSLETGINVYPKV